MIVGSYGICHVSKKSAKLFSRTGFQNILPAADWGAGAHDLLMHLLMRSTTLGDCHTLPLLGTCLGADMR